MSTGFPSVGVCERCTTDYTRQSPRSKYCVDCKPIVKRELRRQHYMSTNGKDKSRRHYSKLADELHELEPLYLPYEEGVEHPSLCDKCAFESYCKMISKRANDEYELPCFPASPDHIIWKEYKR